MYFIVDCVYTTTAKMSRWKRRVSSQVCSAMGTVVRRVSTGGVGVSGTLLKKHSSTPHNQFTPSSVLQIALPVSCSPHPPPSSCRRGYLDLFFSFLRLRFNLRIRFFRHWEPSKRETEGKKRTPACGPAHNMKTSQGECAKGSRPGQQRRPNKKKRKPAARCASVQRAVRASLITHTRSGNTHALNSRSASHTIKPSHKPTRISVQRPCLSSPP